MLMLAPFWLLACALVGDMASPLEAAFALIGRDAHGLNNFGFIHSSHVPVGAMRCALGMFHDTTMVFPGWDTSSFAPLQSRDPLF